MKNETCPRPLKNAGYFILEYFRNIAVPRLLKTAIVCVAGLSGIAGYAQGAHIPICEMSTSQQQNENGNPDSTAGKVGHEPYDLDMACGGTNISLANIFNWYFKYKESYLPLAGNSNFTTVPKKIRVRFVILEPYPGGPNKMNYRPNTDPADLDALLQLVTKTNQILANLTAPNYSPPGCSNCYTANSRIQLDLTEIESRQYTDLKNGITASDNANLGWNMNYITQGQYEDSILNIFFVSNPYRVDVDAAGNTFYRAGGAMNFTDLNNYISPNNPNNNSGPWGKINPAPHPEINPATGKVYDPPSNYYPFIVLRNQYLAGVNLITEEPQHLIHELGHLIGNLGHLIDDERGFIASNPDYLSDIYGSTGQYFPLPYVTNNFMDADINAGRYFSPLQLSRIHRNAFLANTRHFTYPVEAPTAHPLMVTSDYTFDFPMRMYQDIRIQSGKTLTVKCVLEMPADSRIVVEKGGTLIVDGGVITSYGLRQIWKGIEVKGNKNKTSTSQNQGTVILKNGASIENAREGVWNFSFENLSTEGGGGIIKAQDCHFYNCRRAVALSSYDINSYAGNCTFNNVDFIIDKFSPFVFQYNNQRDDYFTAFNIKSPILIKNCRFRNDISYTSLSQGTRRGAIVGVAASYNISDCTFEGFLSGIDAMGYTGTPTRNVNILNSSFNHITRNISISALGYGSIRTNAITNMINCDTNNFVLKGYGIYLDNTKGSYVGCRNFVSGTTDQVQNPNFEGAAFNRRGIIIENTRNDGVTVIDNTFDKIAVGTQTQKNNPLATIFCNTYNNNKTAWQVNPQSNAAGYYLASQGTGCNPSIQTRAGNVFNHAGSVLGGPGIDIANYLTTSWKYYGWENTTNIAPINNSNFSPNLCGQTGIDPNSRCNGGPRNGPVFDICNERFASASDRIGISLSSYYDLVKADEKWTPDARMLFTDIMNGYNEKEDYDGMKAFLENEDDDNARKLLIPIYIENGAYEDASYMIDLLSISNDEKAAYHSYYDILISMAEQGRSVDDIYEEEWAAITDWAHQDLEISPYAKALLQYSGREEWEHIIEEPEITIAKGNAQNILNTHAGSELYDAIPNPARTKTTIQVYVTADDAVAGAQLLVRNMFGTVMGRYILKSGDNSITFDMTAYTSGIHLYSLQVGSKTIAVKKLAIVK